MSTRATLVGRRPTVAPEELLAAFVPPRHFAHATFDSYHPDPAHPSQRAARDRLQRLAADLRRPTRRSWFRSSRPDPTAVYLDGGFGVGKTHLLAALAHEVGGAAGGGQGGDRLVAYGSFVELTQLVGALGFGPAVTALSVRRLVCIDEFELDDPGDTLLMSRLLRELTDAGVHLAATSNTLPESLGEGRFAAEDFLREIQALAARFEVLRIDGPDYRHRGVPTRHHGLPDDVVRSTTAATPDATCDTWTALIEHLRSLHPSRYGALLDGVRLVGITDVGTARDEADAIRLVALVDRLYEEDVPVLLGGRGTEGMFDEAMLRGGYRKKYLRALSRLGALVEQGEELSARA